MRALLASLCVLARQALAYDFTCPPSDRYESTDAYRVSIGEEDFVPVLASKNPTQTAHLAIIVLHGSNGNLEESFWNMTSVVAEQECGSAGTVVVAPAFAETMECSARDWGKSGRSSSNALTWPDAHAWSVGQKDDREDGISSFQVLDKVIGWVQEEWKDLRFIVVVGFSTGAQLALHWSIFSPEGVNGMTSTGLPLRTIVASPDTVTYFNDSRPAEFCAEEDENVTDAPQCSSYPLPESGSRRRDTFVAKSCNGDWDVYEFGLGDLEEGATSEAARDVAGYLLTESFVNTSLQSLAGERFKTKDVRFLAATADAAFCSSGVCSDNCAAMITGSSRLQRLLNYRAHLEGALSIEPKPLEIFEGSHSLLATFQSSYFSEWGFPELKDDLGNCSVQIPSDAHDFKCPPSEQFRATDAYRVSIEGDLFLPVLASKSRTQGVLNAIVVLHGARRNVEEAFSSMTSIVAEQQCGEESTVVVAPAFVPDTPEQPCTGDKWGGSGASSSQAITWSATQQWSTGEKDDSSEVSSFFVLDRVIQWLHEEWKSLRFIIVAGFSTGAELALRWSIFSPEGVAGNTTKNIPLRVVVASPDSVIYLDEGRPAENCTEEADDLTTDFRCFGFPLPEVGSRRRGTQVQRSCNGAWDEYEFGLTDLHSDVVDYVEGEMESSGTDLQDSLRERFKSKDLRFLAGREDTRLCGLGVCDDSCGALITGSSRLQRMLNYIGHLEDIVDRVPRLEFFEGPHTLLSAFRSSFFLEWGFPGLTDEQGNCTADSVDFSIYIPRDYVPLANAFRCPPSNTAYRTKDALRLVVDGGFVPLLASKAPKEVVVLAVVVLHDEHRNVEEVYANMNAAVAAQRCGKESTLVIALAFPPDTLAAACNARIWGTFGGSTVISLVWSDTRWTHGERDTRNRISSFDALDRLMVVLQQEWPTLQSIVVVGFGAGAELALRWSVFSAVGLNGVTSEGVPLRIVVASPDTVTYLDQTRPAENCTEGESLPIDFRCTSYPLPESGSRRRGLSVARSCGGSWDDYEFGLSGLAVDASTRRKRNVASYLPEVLRTLPDLPAAIRERFKSKEVFFLASSDDALPCFTGMCREDSCSAQITGSSRLQRLLHFMGHLGQVLGKEPSFGVFQGPRAALATFQSSLFAQWSFSTLVDGNGECSIEYFASTTTLTTTEKRNDFDDWPVVDAASTQALHRLVGLAAWLGCLVSLLPQLPS